MPMVLGHEAAGEVVECGAGVTDLKSGDQVVLAFVPSCGSCLPCMEGRPGLCEPGAPPTALGRCFQAPDVCGFMKTPIYHHIGVSGYAEYRGRFPTFCDQSGSLRYLPMRQRYLAARF